MDFRIRGHSQYDMSHNRLCLWHNICPFNIGVLWLVCVSLIRKVLGNVNYISIQRCIQPYKNDIFTIE